MTLVKNLKLSPMDPKTSVYVGRAGQGQSGYFGNPVVRGKPCPICKLTHWTVTDVLSCFDVYFEKRVNSDETYREELKKLKDKELFCFCRPIQGFNGEYRCHAQRYAAWLDNCTVEEVK